MISGVVPVIISISVFSAWLVTILSVARNDSVNKLRIGRRLFVVFGISVLAALAANRYVKWCLLNYYKSQPTASMAPRADDDRLIYQRLKEIIDEEVPKYVQITPSGKIPAKPEKADLILDFAGVEDLQLMLHCTTKTPAEKPKHWFGMIDATNMFEFPSKPGDYQPLPLQTQTWDTDYVRQDIPTGPYSILSESPAEIAKQHVKRGDVILGMIGVTCINCAKARRYYVYFQQGSGGWFYQVPKGKELHIPMPKTKAITTSELKDFIDKEVPPQSRTVIKSNFN